MTNATYFDEMNIANSDKDARTSMCNELSGAIYKELQEYKNGNENRFEERLAFVILLILFRFDILDDSKVSRSDGFSFLEDSMSGNQTKKHKMEKSVLEILNEITEDAKNISNTTAETIATEYATSKERADFIARNITNKYNNINNHAIAVQAGIKYHIWRSEKDGRVRKTHESAEGQKKKIGEPFVIGGYYMMYPMDGQFGAPANEILNCRCVETFSR